MDVAKDVLVTADLPTALNDFCEFEVGDDLGNPSELDVSIKSNIKHHDLDESEVISLQEPCEEGIEPTNLDFDDDILIMEYKSFSYGFDVNVSLDVDLCVEYESFSFDPIQTALLFENCKFAFVEFETIVTENFDLDHTLVLFNITRLVDSEPTILPRLFVPYDIFSRPMTHQLASLNYICLSDVWAHAFNKFQQALTFGLGTWWM